MRLPGAHSRTVEEGGPPVGTGATVVASSSFHTSVGEREGASCLAAPAGPLQPRVPAACRPPQSLAGKGVQSPASGATERRDGTVPRLIARAGSAKPRCPQRSGLRAPYPDV